MTTEKFDKMSFEQLMKWRKSDASDEASSEIWDEWSSDVEKKAKKFFWNMDFCQLTQFYRDHPHEDMPPWEDAWIESIKGGWPFEDIFSRLMAIEKSLDMILKKIGSDNADISINQLIRLKRGHSV